MSSDPLQRPGGQAASVASAEQGRPRGRLFIVSGPSGAGKTTLSGAALRAFPDLTLSVSCTTRSPRGGEVDGVQYSFVDAPTFAKMVERGDLAEWAQVHGYSYGTPRAPLDGALVEGRDMLLDIDVQGAAQVRALYPRAVSVFLLPPDRATLESRLRGRGTDSEAVVQRRLENACREIERAVDYDHVIVNRDREAAIAQFESIVRDAHRPGGAPGPVHRAGMSEAGLLAFLRTFTGEV